MDSLANNTTQLKDTSRKPKRNSIEYMPLLLGLELDREDDLSDMKAEVSVSPSFFEYI